MRKTQIENTFFRFTKCKNIKWNDLIKLMSTTKIKRFVCKQQNKITNLQAPLRILQNCIFWETQSYILGEPCIQRRTTHPLGVWHIRRWSRCCSHWMGNHISKALHSLLFSVATNILTRHNKIFYFNSHPNS